MKLSRNRLKVLALIGMTMNHIGYLFLPAGFLKDFFIGLGNGTAVMMVCFLADGYFYTRSRARYAFRLFFTALISQIPFQMAFWDYPTGLNMMFSLLFCLAACRVYELENPVKKALGYLPIACLACFSDWGILPILYTVFFLSEKKGRIPKGLAGLLCFVVFLTKERAGLPVVLLHSTGFLFFLWWYCFRKETCELPRESPDKRKYGFYLYYPLHLAVLAFLNQ